MAILLCNALCARTPPARVAMAPVSRHAVTLCTAARWHGKARVNLERGRKLASEAQLADSRAHRTWESLSDPRGNMVQGRTMGAGLQRTWQCQTLKPGLAEPCSQRRLPTPLRTFDTQRSERGHSATLPHTPCAVRRMNIVTSAWSLPCGLSLLCDLALPNPWLRDPRALRAAAASAGPARRVRPLPPLPTLQT